MAIQTKVKRKYTRFTPDPDDYVLILSGAQGRVLKNSKICLLVQESFGGCSIVLTQDEQPLVGSTMQVQVGRQSAMQAEIRWVKKLDTGVFSLGLQYQLEKPNVKK